MSQTYDLAVIGAGPGGYTAAFRAADLGLSVALIDPRETLGGTCLNIGCIPSKALLHIAKIRDDARDAAQHGLTFAEPQIDLGAIHRYRDGVVSKLTQGLRGLAKRRKVEVIRAKAHFLSPERLALISDTGESELHFRQAVIATGSAPIGLGFLPQDPRIIDSTGALALTSLPKHLVILGGGIIGLEMAQVYLSLGSQVTIIEQAPQLIPGTDAALVAPLAKRLTTRGVSLRLGCKVTAVTAEDDLAITLDTANGPEVLRADRLLVAVGRRPVTEDLNLAAAGLVAERGFLQVDAAMRTTQPHIFAIGDCVGQPMLAHKASHEGKVAAEAAAGHQVAFEAKVIPSVAYTDPEIAWVGLTETAAKASGQAYDIASFPWAASGRALTLGRDEGLTRLLIDPTTRRVIGAGITGPHAGDLIAEATLAIEMGADAADLALTVHPHPTLSESLGLAAEMLEGTITDL